MIVKEKEIKVSRSEDFKEVEFKIKASRQAFEILSSGIYTDIPLAIIRELSTNAWDAHVEAGNTNTRFEVHLPNEMEPYLSIRDFGKGLSAENLEELYTTYFASTKTSSNDYTGCLGIGSKSPFAYTDSFQVISRYEGKKRSYNCFKGEEGFPKVALMTVADTDEPTGLEIVIGIDKADFYTFATKAVALFPYFVLPPVVTGNRGDYKWELPEPIYEGSCWKFLGPGRDYYDNKSFGVMGNVCYPINRHDSLPGKYRELLRRNKFVIQFDIGDLDMTAGREELQWNERTINSITKKLEIVKQELSKEVQKQFKDCSCLWDANLLCNELLGTDGSMKHLKFIFNVGGAEWRGQQITGKIMAAELFKTGIKVVKMTLKNQSSRTICSVSEVKHALHVEPRTKLMIDDLPRAGRSRTRSWMKENSMTHCRLYLVPASTPAERKALYKVFGNNKSHWLKTSDLPKAVRRQYTPTKKNGKVIMLKWRPQTRYYSAREDWWEEVEVDPKLTSGIFVPVRGLSIFRGDEKIDPRSIHATYKILADLDVDPVDIYGVKNAFSKKLANVNSKWQDFYEYANEQYDIYIAKHNLKTSMGDWKVVSQISDCREIKILNKLLMRNWPGAKGCDFNKFAEAVHKAESQHTEEVKKAIEFRGVIGRWENDEITGGSAVCDILSESSKTLGKYPLIKILLENAYNSFSNDDSKMLELAKYIYMIEKENENV